MTYDDFLMRLEKLILDGLEPGEQIRRVQVLKNNGVWLDGFSYQAKGRREHPTAYVNQYYYEEISGDELENTAGMVIRILRESRLLPEEGLEQLLEFDKMKGRIFYRLISKARNKELLGQVPWLPWLDMAIVFYLRIPERIVDNATALIRTGHMEHWGITLGALYRTASKNMAGMPILLEPMEAFLENRGALSAGGSGMYVLSNGRKEYGAAAIVDPKVQRMCFEKMGEDYYILPSSIHELILLPQSRSLCRKSLDELVQEVNESCVSSEDFLSGHAYFYSSAAGQIK